MHRHLIECRTSTPAEYTRSHVPSDVIMLPAAPHAGQLSGGSGVGADSGVILR
jgi:hypothetical protein